MLSPGSAASSVDLVAGGVGRTGVRKSRASLA